MIYSLNEIDVHCKKAARGVGFEWGYAEEIGKIARWLAAYELPGVGVLASYLSQRNSESEKLTGPSLGDNASFRPSADKLLCPILTSAYLADQIQINSDTKLEFQHIAYPLLLLPCLAQLAGRSNQVLKYQFNQTTFRFADGRLNCTDATTLIPEQADLAICSFNPESVDGKPANVVGLEVNNSDWQILNKFATKIYVPASEASRQGAGPSD